VNQRREGEGGGGGGRTEKWTETQTYSYYVTALNIPLFCQLTVIVRLYLVTQITNTAPVHVLGNVRGFYLSLSFFRPGGERGGLPTVSMHPEGPPTGHHDRGFLGFPLSSS